jgi:S-adenosylmethionine-diacylgycerolhomoserine-N-methlytransferase
MIPTWRGALDQAIKVVAPGGALYIVDFGELNDLPNWFKTGLLA